MGDAPDKPDPTGLLRLSTMLAGRSLGKGVPPIAYLGDTVADVLTIQQARKIIPDQTFISLAVVPPHIHKQNNDIALLKYEHLLKKAGADKILKCTTEVLKLSNEWQDS